MFVADTDAESSPLDESRFTGFIGIGWKVKLELFLKTGDSVGTFDERDFVRLLSDELLGKLNVR